MKANGKIKVVKRADVPVRSVKKPVKTARATARDMVSTVTDWVTDFKTRKSEETKAAIEQLFPTGPHPSES
ncbi:MAG: hypothetical protein JSS77_00090 [Acidobacteria bacterium]|nr:hypothetical protein [Acidobacteriota bacterium]